MAVGPNIPEEIAKTLATDPDSRVRYWTTKSRYISVLRLLSTDPDDMVRESVAMSDTIPDDILEALANDASPKVSKVARDNQAIRRNRFFSGLLEGRAEV